MTDPNAKRTPDEAYRQRQRRYKKKMRQRTLVIIGVRCVFCRSTKNVEAAHVLPTQLSGRSRGSKRRYHDVRRNPECYRPMCKRCHQTYDMLRNLNNHDPTPICDGE